MKRIGLLLLSSLLFLGATTFAGSTCREVEFPNGRVCVDIIKKTSNTFELDTTIQKGNGNLRCAIYYPSTNSSKEISNCNGEFFVNSPREQMLKLYIKSGKDLPTDRDGKPNEKQEWIFPQRGYDFNIGERSYFLGENNSDNNYQIDRFALLSNTSHPQTNERIDLNIKAQNRNNNTVTDYRGTINFKVYYRTSSSSTWRTASYSDYEFRTISSERYNFDSYDRGEVNLSREIRFKRDYDFKVEITDSKSSNIKGEKIFYLDDYNNNYELDKFSISTNTSYPKTNERIDLNIKALDRNNNTVTDYRGNIRFNIYYSNYRLNSSSWNLASYSDYEFNTINNDRYNFVSNDRGEINLNRELRFKKDWVFKVEIVDSNNNYIKGEKVFYLDNYNNDNNYYDLDKFSISTNTSYPQTNERIDLNIKAQNRNNSTITDYRGTVNFKVYYRTSSSSTWRTASYSDYEFRTISSEKYNFDSYDRGEVNLSREIRFKRDYDFKVEVVDSRDSYIKGEKIFYLENNSSVYGFSSSELSNIRKVYNVRDDLITALKRSSRNLRTNQRWMDMSDDLQIEMKRILDNSSYKKYSTYREFGNAFNERYTYTLRYQ